MGRYFNAFGLRVVSPKIEGPMEVYIQGVSADNREHAGKRVIAFYNDKGKRVPLDSMENCQAYAQVAKSAAVLNLVLGPKICSGAQEQHSEEVVSFTRKIVVFHRDRCMKLCPGTDGLTRNLSKALETGYIQPYDVQMTPITRECSACGNTEHFQKLRLTDSARRSGN